MLRLISAYILCTGLQFYTEIPRNYSGQRPGSYQEVIVLIPQWNFNFWDIQKMLSFIPLACFFLRGVAHLAQDLVGCYGQPSVHNTVKLLVRIPAEAFFIALVCFFFRVLHLAKAKWAGPVSARLCETPTFRRNFDAISVTQELSPPCSLVIIVCFTNGRLKSPALGWPI